MFCGGNIIKDIADDTGPGIKFVIGTPVIIMEFLGRHGGRSICYLAAVIE